MSEHEKISYVEFPAKDIAATKLFFNTVFGWDFVDYGSEYCSFFNEGINGGFFKSDLTVSASNGSALVVMYSNNLKNSQQKIEQAGGSISTAIFDFLGGRRFHFLDPNGNEYAVWSDKS